MEELIKQALSELDKFKLPWQVMVQKQLEYCREVILGNEPPDRLEELNMGLIAVREIDEREVLHSLLMKIQYEMQCKYLPQDEGKEAVERAVYHCSVCSKEAAGVKLVEEKKTDGTTQWWIRISDFIGVVSEVVAESAVDSFRRYLRRGDAALLPERFAPFYCRQCGKCYCIDHWLCEVRYDDDFYDCTYGTCPEGHRKMIDD